MNIAIYGKGGIGKSTVSSNVSAILAYSGKKVLQIGCDPKHDSTLLLTGSDQVTVLDKINYVELKKDDLIKKGIYGIDCVEMGGPTPGVGCAGRGIITGMKMLDDLKILDDNEYDVVIYDILGDVVCGGFFEPLKGGFVDKFYVVTSGEFNSLFAANNLLQGYINCKLEKKGVRIGGLIANYRGGKDEEEIVNSFAQLVNVPLVSCIPRDLRIEQSTFKGIPIVQMNNQYANCEDLVSMYKEIAKDIFSISNTEIKPKAVTLNEIRKLYEYSYK